MTILEQTGYDFHIHAIGDRGITESLDAVEAARNANGDIGARHRITHVEIVKESDYPRFAQLNVTADMQVASDFTNPENWEENLPFLGADRIDNIIPLKSIFETGARVTLSSDWDVSSLNPFIGMQNALTRAPQNLPTIEDAVKAYTINGAYVLRQETNTESLEVGKWADFICVNQDIFTVPTNQIAQTIVLST
jgi:predicted amidohydrolase YtcJ